MSKIKTKKEAFDLGYLVSSGTNIDGKFFTSVKKRPPNLNMSSTFAYAGGGTTEEEALEDAFSWIEAQKFQDKTR